MLQQFGFGYLLFHALLTVPVILILYVLQTDLGAARNKRRRDSFIILVLIAYVYTIPWDNFMISVDVWWYADIIWKRVWYAPIGEYLFFGIQTIIAGLYLYYIDFDPTPQKSDLRLRLRLLGFLMFMCVAAVASYIAVYGNSSLFYLMSIIAWTGPVVAIQWLVGGYYIIRNWKVITASIVPPTVYMWIIDGYAISTGLWTIGSETSTGIAVGPLPVEEMLFFLSANIMTVFGIVLYEWVLEVWKNGDEIFMQDENDKVCRLYYLFE